MVKAFSPYSLILLILLIMSKNKIWNSGNQEKIIKPLIDTNDH